MLIRKNVLLACVATAVMALGCTNSDKPADEPVGAPAEGAAVETPADPEAPLPPMGDEAGHDGHDKGKAKGKAKAAPKKGGAKAKKKG